MSLVKLFLLHNLDNYATMYRKIETIPINIENLDFGIVIIEKLELQNCYMHAQLKLRSWYRYKKVIRLIELLYEWRNQNYKGIICKEKLMLHH